MSEEVKIHDFGFSFANEAEIKKAEKDALSTKEKELSDAQRKLIGLRDKFIVPLLESLKKDPHKDFIKWPNRVEKIEQYITAINKYIEEA
jgi:hypothetical protein